MKNLNGEQAKGLHFAATVSTGGQSGGKASWFSSLIVSDYGPTVLSRSVLSNSLQPHGQQPTRLLCPWGFSRQEHWSGLPCPPPGDLPNPGIKPGSPALPADSLLSEPPGKPMILLEKFYFFN